MATKFNPGEYVAEITDWGLGESKLKRTPQFVLRFRPLGKVNPNDPKGQLLDCPDLERTLFLYFTPNTRDIVADAMDYLGYNRDSFRYLNRDAEDAHDFLGQQINVRCDHEQFEGNLNERWRLSIGGGMGPIEQLDDFKVMQLDSLFGKSGGRSAPASMPAQPPASDSPAGPAPAPPATSPAGRASRSRGSKPAVEDSDIPF